MTPRCSNPMLRRLSIACIAAVLLPAGTALAATQQLWNPDNKDGSETASRSQNGLCKFSADTTGKLQISCVAGGSATVTYLFTSSNVISGTPTYNLDASRTSGVKLRSSVNVKSNDRIYIRVKVSGAGTTQLRSVSVGYYTR